MRFFRFFRISREKREFFIEYKTKRIRNCIDICYICIIINNTK